MIRVDQREMEGIMKIELMILIEMELIEILRSIDDIEIDLERMQTGIEDLVMIGIELGLIDLQGITQMRGLKIGIRKI